jgi:hypothetical protein
MGGGVERGSGLAPDTGSNFQPSAFLRVLRGKSPDLRLLATVRRSGDAQTVRLTG